MATTATFLPGQTLTATLASLEQAGQVVTDILDPDTIVCQLYTANGVAQTTVGTVLSDGLGNYTYTFLAPDSAGDYYLLWTVTVSGQVGKQRVDFALRLQP